MATASKEDIERALIKHQRKYNELIAKAEQDVRFGDFSMAELRKREAESHAQIIATYERLLEKIR